MRWTIKPKPSEDQTFGASLTYGRFCGYLLILSSFLEDTCTILPDEDMDKAVELKHIETRKTLWFW
jgi:hypothetical protein